MKEGGREVPSFLFPPDPSGKARKPYICEEGFIK